MSTEQAQQVEHAWNALLTVLSTSGIDPEVRTLIESARDDLGEALDLAEEMSAL